MLTTDQRRRLRDIVTRGTCLPIGRDHAKLMLTIDDRRRRERAAELVKGFAFLAVLIALAIAAEAQL